jgi:hypothetical protein
MKALILFFIVITLGFSPFSDLKSETKLNSATTSTKFDPDDGLRYEYVEINGVMWVIVYQGDTIITQYELEE